MKPGVDARVHRIHRHRTPDHDAFTTSHLLTRAELLAARFLCVLLCVAAIVWRDVGPWGDVDAITMTAWTVGMLYYSAVITLSLSSRWPGTDGTEHALEPPSTGKHQRPLSAHPPAHGEQRLHSPHPGKAQHAALRGWLAWLGDGSHVAPQYKQDTVDEPSGAGAGAGASEASDSPVLKARRPVSGTPATVAWALFGLQTLHATAQTFAASLPALYIGHLSSEPSVQNDLASALITYGTLVVCLQVDLLLNRIEICVCNVVGSVVVVVGFILTYWIGSLMNQAEPPFRFFKFELNIARTPEVALVFLLIYMMRTGIMFGFVFWEATIRDAVARWVRKCSERLDKCSDDGYDDDDDGDEAITAEGVDTNQATDLSGELGTSSDQDSPVGAAVAARPRARRDSTARVGDNLDGCGDSSTGSSIQAAAQPSLAAWANLPRPSPALQRGAV
ncbi:hypothetical protein HK105_202044 [Polyrhizophydium stewartii]|uniref:Transmembrane protein n=1 Tax=Polyrhizophydium stewartii TaxID=2732419 RepID=A0ABR4NGI3_9FUNG